eukprot:357424_1
MFLLLALIASVSGRFQKHAFGNSNTWTDNHAMELASPECHMTPSYPPPAERRLIEFVIDLDSDAKTRWSEPTKHFKDGINKMLKLVTSKFARIDKIIDN